MNVSLDTVSSAVNDTQVTSLSWSHTVASSANGLLVALGNVTTDSGNRFTSSVKYAGVNLSSITSVFVRDGGSTTTNMSELWYLANPATGANTVTCTFNNGVRTVGIGASLIDVSSTSATGASTTSTGSGHTVQLTGITANGTSDLVVAAACCGAKGHAMTFSVTASGQTLSLGTRSGTAGASAAEGLDTGAASGVSSSASILIVMNVDTPVWAASAVAVLAPGAAPAAATGGAAFYLRRRRYN